MTSELTGGSGSRFFGFCMALPAFVLLFTFIIWPIVVAGDYSFDDASGFGGRERVGLENYREALGDDRLLDALIRNVVFAVIVVTLSVTVGFVLAYFLYQRTRGWRPLQVIFMVPYVMPLVVTALLWKFILEPTSGLLNSSLRALGLDALAGPWLSDPSTALVTVSLVQVWVTAPFAMLLIYGSMVSLPGEVFEAAQIDGASHFRRMFSIALPMLRTTVVLVSLLLTINVFRSFDLILLLTNGGPINSTTTATLYVYIKGFVDIRYGYANALGIMVGLLLVIFAVVPMIARRVRTRRAA